MSTGKFLVYLMILCTFVLICWGAYLTAGGWGGACGGGSSTAISSDWPFCNGSLNIPNPGNPATYGAFVEYIHRTLSVLVGVVTLVTILGVRRMNPRPAGAYRALLVAGVLLVIQIGLGNLVVNSNLNAVVTAIHLANATALFGVMVIAGVLMHLEERMRPY